MARVEDDEGVLLKSRVSRTIDLPEEMDSIIGFRRLLNQAGHGTMSREIERDGCLGTFIRPEQRPDAVLFVKSPSVVEERPFNGTLIGDEVISDSEEPEEGLLFRVESVVEAIGKAEISGAIMGHSLC